MFIVQLHVVKVTLITCKQDHKRKVHIVIEQFATARLQIAQFCASIVKDSNANLTVGN